jgi:hypothetical protein
MNRALSLVFKISHTFSQMQNEYTTATAKQQQQSHYLKELVLQSRFSPRIQE